MRQRPFSLRATNLALGFSLLALSTPVRAAGADAPSVEEIVAASVAAAGGDALDEVRTIRRHADMHLESEVFGTLDGRWEISYFPGKRGFQRADFGIAVTTTVWDGTAGWEDSATGLRELNDQEITLNQWQWEVSLLHALRRDGRLGALQRVDDEAIGDKSHYVLALVGESGTETRIFVDPETHLVSRLTTTLEIPMLGPSAVTTDFSDYRELDGLLLPCTTKQIIDGLWELEATFTETEVDAELSEELFERPAP